MSTFGVKTQIVFQLVSNHNWFSKGSLIEGEQDFTKNFMDHQMLHFEDDPSMVMCL